MHPLTLVVLDDPLAICHFSADAAVPAWVASARQFSMIVRTPAELTIVADAACVPAGVDAARDYRALRVEGPLPLHLVGVMAAIAGPLAAAEVPIFPIATHDTDYILVADRFLMRAAEALRSAGHEVRSDRLTV